MFKITKASPQKNKLRLMIWGPSSSGKTYTALQWATRLGKTLCIDTQGGQSNFYGDGHPFEFDILTIEDDFSPNNMLEAVKFAKNESYDCVVIDSLSAEYEDANGILEQHNRMAKRMKDNTMLAWAKITPIHNRFLRELNMVDMHVFATVRAKELKVQERDAGTGRMKFVSAGFDTVQKAGIEYHFDVKVYMDEDHGATFKLRDHPLDGEHVEKPDATVIDSILARGSFEVKPLTIVASGVGVSENREVETVNKDQALDIWNHAQSKGWDKTQLSAFLYDQYNIDTMSKIPVSKIAVVKNLLSEESSIATYM